MLYYIILHYIILKRMHGGTHARMPDREETLEFEAAKLQSQKLSNSYSSANVYLLAPFLAAECSAPSPWVSTIDNHIN